MGVAVRDRGAPDAVERRGKRTLPYDDIDECIFSAEFWVDNLPLFAYAMRKWADRFELGSGALSLITGLTVWAALSSSTAWWARLLVSAMALAAGVGVLVPKVMTFRDAADKGTAIVEEYAKSLMSLREAKGSEDRRAMEAAVTSFHKVKTKKDQLHPFPLKLQRRISSLRDDPGHLSKVPEAVNP